jgi:hypothetical protein
METTPYLPFPTTSADQIKRENDNNSHLQWQGEIQPVANIMLLGILLHANVTNKGVFMPNKRRFSRIQFNVKCFLALDSNQIEVSLIDIALKGALVEMATPLEVKQNAPCALTIELPGLETPLQFSADLVHINNLRLGLKFTTTDIDSMIHLRSIVESNSADPEKISQELSFLIDAN